MHVRFTGRSTDLSLAELNVSARASDAELKRAVEDRLEMAPYQLEEYVIERHDNGNLTIRPEFTFDWLY